MVYISSHENDLRPILIQQKDNPTFKILLDPGLHIAFYFSPNGMLYMQKLMEAIVGWYDICHVFFVI